MTHLRRSQKKKGELSNDSLAAKKCLREQNHNTELSDALLFSLEQFSPKKKKKKFSIEVVSYAIPISLSCQLAGGRRPDVRRERASHARTGLS